MSFVDSEAIPEPLMQILLLGPPVIYFGEQPGSINRKSLRHLLYFLACQEDWISRGDLILTFWPDESDRAARQHLRESLSKLRSQLPNENLLQTEQNRVRLDLERIFVDVRRFQELLKKSAHLTQAIASAPLPEPIYQDYLEANRLWRSNRFMSGANASESEEFDRWLVNTSQQLEFAHLDLLQRLGDDAALRGDRESALYWIRKGLELDFFDSELHLRLLQNLRELGRMEEARAHITTISEFYRAEGMADLPEEILKFKEKLTRESSRPIHTGRVLWPGTLSLQLPFVGRGEALHTAQNAFHLGGILVIIGEGGSGKTRLVRELYSSLEPTPRLLLGICKPLENEMPFQPIIDLLRQNVTPEEWDLLEPVWGNQLTALVPEISSARGHGHTSQRVSPDFSQQQVFEALHQLLTILGRESKILFFLDDAQWSDETTFSALAYLLERQFFKEHGLLVVAARTEQRHSAHDSILRKFRIDQNQQHLMLSPLDLDAVTILARMALGRTPTENLARQLYEGSGGNPLFILELLRALLEHSIGPDRYWSGDTLPLPTTLQALLRDKIAKLSPLAQDLLSVASVIGTTFDITILEKASQKKPEQVAEGLDELVKAHIIRPDEHPGAGLAYTFIHQKIQELQLRELSPAKRRLLHLRIAQALSKKENLTETHAATIAQHFQAAGENLPAFQNWLLAAEHARKLSSQSEAFRAYHQAEQLLPTIAAQLPDQMIDRLFSGIGELGYDMGDESIVSKASNTLRTYAEMRNSLFLMASALRGLAGAAVLRREPEKTSELLEEAIPYMEETGSTFNKMWAYNRLGFYRLMTTKLEESIQAYETSLQIGKGSIDSQCVDARAEALAQMALVQSFQGKPVEAHENVSKVLTPTPSPSIRHGTITYAHLSHCYSLFWLGRYQECQSAALEGIEHARLLQNMRVEGYLQVSLAYASLALGNLETGYTACQNAIDLAKKIHNPDLLSEANNVLADFHTALGDDAHFPKDHDELAKDATQKYQIIQGKFRHAAWLCRLGKHEKGLADLERCIQETGELNLHLLTWQAKIYHAQTLIVLNRIDEAEREIQSVLSESNPNQVRLIRPNPELLVSQIFLLKDNPEKAIEWINPILAFARSSNAALLEIEALQLLEHIQQTGEAPDNYSRRVLEILGNIENPAEGSPLLPGFEAWRSRLLESFSR